MTTTSIYRAEVSSRPAARFDGDGNPVSGTGQALEIRSEARGSGWSIGMPAPRLTGAEPSRRETDLRAAARRHGLTMKEPEVMSRWSLWARMKREKSSITVTK